MRHADILLTPLPVCVVESVQQLQTLSKEHFPILLTASSKLFLVYDDNHQKVLKQLVRRQTRKKPKSFTPTKPEPIRASILSKEVYYPLKNKFIQYIDEAHCGISTPDNNITLIKLKLHSISLKHRLMTSRTEWQRLQNLRWYLSRKLGTILTNQQLLTTPFLDYCLVLYLSYAFLSRNARHNLITNI